MAIVNKENIMTGLFGIEEARCETKDQEVVQEIDIELLFPSERNPYNVKMDKAMEELIASIETKGISEPLLVRKRLELAGYEVMSGHRRLFAAQKVGLKKAPVLIRNVSDEDRDITIADANLHRPKISIQEKSWAIRLKYDALKKKKGRNWDGEKGSTAKRIAEEMGMSERTIHNYLSLTQLIAPLLDLVDDTITVKAGLQLSSLSEQAQQCIYEVLQTDKSIKVNNSLAIDLRKQLLKKDIVTTEMVIKIINPQTISEKPAKQIGIKMKKAVKQKYFPEGYQDDQINQVIEELLDLWARQHNPDYSGHNNESHRSNCAPGA
ncbi:ParB/RepB/Spo0J family partition protein [Clostridiales Family XIII bacterium ASD5510]|uniref:ParB/RepB/Spo0J family partition protein n=1 Tax=Hominibacterium faecale TaxID=2839743 RepID=A0A9J6QNC0_9FIRM|nr:ParB/RepB/Spo0J family partition protein [Hominibacterium faecale]MCU7378896.1 ParB/RepB/Spo0J family partition protein [Hominibacterium faecale]